MTIYRQAIEAVTKGATFKVNLQQLSLKINHTYLIKEGKFNGVLGIEPEGEESVLNMIEDLYHTFKYSTPSERSESKHRQYFKALPERELSDDAMFFGQPRELAQIKLELYILCQLIQGFKWNAETMGNWFYQGKTDKDLIILKDWIEPQNTNKQNNSNN